MRPKVRAVIEVRIVCLNTLKVSRCDQKKERRKFMCQANVALFSYMSTHYLLQCLPKKKTKKKTPEGMLIFTLFKL